MVPAGLRGAVGRKVRTPVSTGELAQLARASALQAEGQGFKPPILQTVEAHKEP